jgi:hypothetical protein
MKRRARILVDAVMIARLGWMIVLWGACYRAGSPDLAPSSAGMAASPGETSVVVQPPAETPASVPSPPRGCARAARAAPSVPPLASGQRIAIIPFGRVFEDRSAWRLAMKKMMVTLHAPIAATAFTRPGRFEECMALEPCAMAAARRLGVNVVIYGTTTPSATAGGTDVALESVELSSGIVRTWKSSPQEAEDIFARALQKAHGVLIAIPPGAASTP